MSYFLFWWWELDGEKNSHWSCFGSEQELLDMLNSLEPGAGPAPISFVAIKGDRLDFERVVRYRARPPR